MCGVIVGDGNFCASGELLSFDDLCVTAASADFFGDKLSCLTNMRQFNTGHPEKKRRFNGISIKKSCSPPGVSIY